MVKHSHPSVTALERFASLPDEAGIRLPTACSVMSCSPATVWRLAKAGTLTARKVSTRVTIFNVGSIRAVLNGNAPTAK